MAALVSPWQLCDLAQMLVDARLGTGRGAPMQHCEGPIWCGIWWNAPDHTGPVECSQPAV